MLDIEFSAYRSFPAMTFHYDELKTKEPCYHFAIEQDDVYALITLEETECGYSIKETVGRVQPRTGKMGQRQERKAQALFETLYTLMTTRLELHGWTRQGAYWQQAT